MFVIYARSLCYKLQVIYAKDGEDHKIKNGTQVMVNFLDGKVKDKSYDQLLKVLESDFKDAECSVIALWSQGDWHAMPILDSTVTKIDGHYSVGLLWKTEELDPPNNRSLAEKRLKSLTKKFCKNPNLFKCYLEKINEYIRNYAELVSEKGELYSTSLHFKITKI